MVKKLSLIRFTSELSVKVIASLTYSDDASSVIDCVLDINFIIDIKQYTLFVNIIKS
jgi:hypothetical protein